MPLPMAARRDRTANARAAERTFVDTLDAHLARLGGSQRLTAPPRRERVAKRFGGGTRDVTHGNYDWFYELHPAEQARIRRNWMTDRGISPDEVEDAGLPMREWLTLTRGIDAAKAVRTGRELSKKRYGDSHPLKFLEQGSPEDYGDRVDGFEDRHGRPHPPAGSAPGAVQFYTDSNGVVHPIRASEPASERPYKAGESVHHHTETYVNAYGEKVSHQVDYDPDEVF